MKRQEIILGEFENEMYARIARRELIIAGINSNIIKEDIAATSSSVQNKERVRLIITDNQLEAAKKVLATKFI